MAEITDTLKLDIDQALRDVQRIEAALDRALAPVELRVDDSSIRRVEDSLERVETAARETTGQVRLTADEYREVARAVELGVDPARAIARATGEVREQASLAEADFRDVAAALDISEDQARDLAREILEAQQAATRLEDAARDVARQLDLSEDEADQLASGLGRANRAADDINVRTGALVGTFASLRGAAAGVAGVLATIGIGQGIALAARGANAAVLQFQALNESINAIKVTFEEGSDAIFDFGEISAEVAGLSAQAFQQAVVPIGAILRNFGLDAGEAADASIILVQRAADLASVFNVDVEDALLAINSALVGQVEPLRRFGAEISVARVEAFLLASGMVASADEIDQAALVQGRLALILQDTNRAAGDFVNTSGEFANASRIAQAETEEFAAAAGEELLPAFEALLQQAPAVLAFFDSLLPALGETAEEAAQAGAGVATFVSTVTLGAGQLGDVFGAAFEALEVIPALALDIVNLDLAFTNLNETGDSFNNRVARTLIRTASQSIPQAMSEGDDAATAFANSIAFLGRQSDTTNLLEQSFERLSRVAGLSGRDLSTVTRFLIDNADAASLTASDIQFLNLQLQLIDNSMSTLITETVGASGAFTDLGRGAADVEPVISALDAITLSAELAEVSISEFVLSADPIAQAMVDALDPADRLDLILEAIGEDAAAAAEAFRASLTPALIDANEALVDFNENGVVTLDEFIRASEEAAIAVLAFKANIAIIAETSPEVAASLLALGAEQGALIAQGFVDNPIRILEQEDILLGTSTGLAETINDLVSQAVRIFSSQGPDALADFGLVIAALFPEDPALVKQITDRIDAMLLKGIDPDRIRAAFSQPEAATAGAVITVDAYVAGLEQNLAADVIGISDPIFEAFGIDLTTQGEATTASYLAGLTDDLTANVTALAGPIFNLFDIDLAALGADARSTYFDGLTTPSESETTRLRGSIVNTFQSAIEEHSPSKLFLDFGERSGDAFWSGFNQSELTLRTPAPPITGSVAGSTAGQTVGGVNVEVNINNPTVNDAVSDTARVAQFASSIAASYRSVT